MFYLIIPPVVIVASLSLILYLFSKKGQELVGRETETVNGKLGTNGGADNGAAGPRFAGARNFFLKFLEKFVQRTKVAFLRFHNFSDKLVKSLKEKRKKNGGIEKEAGNIGSVAAVVPIASQEKKAGRPEVLSARRLQVADFAKTEKPVAPTISEKVTRPEPRFIRTEAKAAVAAIPPVEEKKEYEQLLIERIAGNPKDIEAYERLGNYYLEQKSFLDAKECFKQVLRLSPINRQARTKMRRLERILGA